jgi:serine protease Do
MDRSRRTNLALLLAAAFACATDARAQEPATPPVAPTAAPAPATTPQLVTGDAPMVLDDGRRIELRKRLSTGAARVCPNVVQLSIERRVGDGLVVVLEASGLVLGRDGHVVTIGSSLEQAGRVSVYFANQPGLRPRRARFVGVDEATDVGVVEVGPVDLPTLELAADAAPRSADGAGAPSPETRYVVTLFGTGSPEEGGVALGWMHDPLRNSTFGRRRFDSLLRVTLARTPTSAGGVIAQQDGRVVGLLLQPPQSFEVALGGAFAASSGGPALLALPATTMKRGVDALLVARAQQPARLEGSDGDGVPGNRPWLGFSARDLVEPEFLGQLGLGGAVVVSDVFEASPALAAGIEPHDLVLAWNGEALTTVDQLLERVARSEPGSVVELDTLRRLERRKAVVTLAAW